jgi:hypothetical protein
MTDTEMARLAELVEAIWLGVAEPDAESKALGAKWVEAHEAG